MPKRQDSFENLDLFSVMDRSNGGQNRRRLETGSGSQLYKEGRTKMVANQIFAGLDIGTSKISAIIAETDDLGGMKVVGVGVVPSDGLRRGVVVDLEKTIGSIKKAVEEAELMAGIAVDTVYVGIAGEHIRSINSRGVVAVTGPDHEITFVDVQRVIDAAKAVSLPPDRKILHVIPQEFIIDNQGGIKNPVGFSGVRLEVEIHIVTCATTLAQNISRCVERADLGVQELVLEALASSYAVLGRDEMEIGVALIDFGGGTTDIALFFEGGIRYTAVVGLGGRNVTNDISRGLCTPVDQAEKIKIKYGSAIADEKQNDELIEVPGVGGRRAEEVPKSYLVSIIQPRVEEILTLAKREIQRSGYADFLNAGIVLTGGGAMLTGIEKLAEQIFGMPIRVGSPRGFGGLVGLAKSPIHSTGIGLIYYGIHKLVEKQNLPSEQNPDDFFEKVWGLLAKIREWLRKFL